MLFRSEKGHRKLQVRSRKDDRDTRGRRVSRTRPVETGRAVWKDWREVLGGRAASNKRRRKEEEDEGDLLGAFFFRIYEFLFTFSNPPPVIHRPHVPERYTIKFVPAVGLISVSPVMSPHAFVSAFDSVAPVISSSEFSVVSSANFVIPTSCIESNP